jgi:hypothetical protein
MKAFHWIPAALTLCVAVAVGAEKPASARSFSCTFLAKIHKAEQFRLPSEDFFGVRYQPASIKSSKGGHLVIGHDAGWAVSLTILDIGQEQDLFRKGDDWTFIIHSPVMSFGRPAEELADQVMRLQLNGSYEAEGEIAFVLLEKAQGPSNRLVAGMAIEAAEAALVENGFKFGDTWQLQCIPPEGTEDLFCRLGGDITLIIAYDKKTGIISSLTVDCPPPVMREKGDSVLLYPVAVELAKSQFRLVFDQKAELGAGGPVATASKSTDVQEEGYTVDYSYTDGTAKRLAGGIREIVLTENMSQIGDVYRFSINSDGMMRRKTMRLSNYAMTEHKNATATVETAEAKTEDFLPVAYLVVRLLSETKPVQVNNGSFLPGSRIEVSYTDGNKDVVHFFTKGTPEFWCLTQALHQLDSNASWKVTDRKNGPVSSTWLKP